MFCVVEKRRSSCEDVGIFAAVGMDARFFDPVPGGGSGFLIFLVIMHFI
jgi:hypothetical protein